MMNNYFRIRSTDIFRKIKVRAIALDFFLVCLALTVVFAPIESFFPRANDWFFRENSLFLSPFAILISLIISCWIFLNKLKFDRQSLKLIWGKFNLKKKMWLLVLIVICAETVLSTGIYELTAFFSSLVSQDFVKLAIAEANYNLTYSGDNLFLKILFWLFLFTVLILVAPITEEFIFRGVILHRWSEKWGVIPGILMSSILFGLIHGNIFFIGITVSGIITALLYIRTRSLTVAIVHHAWHNLIFLIGHFTATNLPIITNPQEITISYLWYGIFNLVLAIPALIYFLKIPKNIRELPYFVNQKSEP